MSPVAIPMITKIRTDQPPLRLSSDAFFSNVCELDLVFNFYKVLLAMHDAASLVMQCLHTVALCQVYAILDEVFLAGEIEETSKDVVLARLEQLEKLE